MNKWLRWLFPFSRLSRRGKWLTVGGVVLVVIIAGVAGSGTKGGSSSSSTLPAVSVGGYLAEDAKNNDTDWQVCDEANLIATSISSAPTDTGDASSEADDQSNVQTGASLLTTAIQQDGLRLGTQFKTDLQTFDGAVNTNRQQATMSLVNSVLTLCQSNAYKVSVALPLAQPPSWLFGPPISAGSTTAPPSTAPPTTVNTKVELIAWWNSIQPEWTAVESDLHSVGSAAGSGDSTNLGAACLQLTADVQSLQSDPPAPIPAINQPFQAALTDYAKAGTECSDGVASQDGSQIAQANADLTAGSSEMDQVTSQVKALGGS